MTSPVDVRVFVQARMSSSRFPGKVLAPLEGFPVLYHVVTRATMAVGKERVCLLTSDHASDDPIVAYTQRFLEVPVFRGSLFDVFDRFSSALKLYPCDWVMRISADSPLIDPNLMQAMIRLTEKPCDLISNVVERTFPSGQSVEIIKSSLLEQVRSEILSNSDREHVTPFFYRNQDRFFIKSVKASAAEWADERMVVDTPQDLDLIKRFFMANTKNFPDFVGCIQTNG